MGGYSLYENLAWLPRPPADFRRLCRSLATQSDEGLGRSVTALAGFGLDENQLLRLSDAIELAHERGRSLAPLTPFKLAIVGNATLSPLVPALIASAPRHGIDLTCIKGDFGQTIQEALSPDSKINRWKPDAVLVALDYRGLPMQPDLAGSGDAGTLSKAAMSFLDTIREGFRQHGGAISIVQTIVPPPEALFGSYDRAVPGTLRAQCAAFNEALAGSLSSTQDVLLDVAALAETVGLASWYDATQWHVGKFPFDASLLPLYADHVCRLVGALRGQSRRCLILDLDNTLWGGVIGDDGLDGIVLGQGNPTGEAFLDVQRYALALRERGIVLAVSSKNDDAVARAVFAKHPEMLLRENHLAVFQANWNDKATNIKSIAAELSLGLSAMVFLDDNPVERGLVREILPEVAVPELPADPALYARTLSAAGYFEALTFSAEDRKRADFYADNARRVTLQQQAGDLEGYLNSLNMTIEFRPFDAIGRSRIAQLVNKSNQFNLTTRRYDELAVAEMESDPAVFGMQVRLVDTFGDNGMISVIVCRPSDPQTWTIDTWLMSCRVLGRRVEQMVLREIIYHARRRGITRLIGEYLPTERNGMVAEHYGKLGFRLLHKDPSGASTWELGTDAEIEGGPMVVDRGAFDVALSPS